ncbi:MAG: HTH domain-containing protein [Haloarculaceae archaeon]
MSSNDTTERLWAELWLRQDTYGTYEAQQATLDRMRTLEAEGVLGDSTVAGWGKQVLTFESDVRTEADAALAAFERWADRADASLEPAFDRRTESSLLSQETYEVAIFPVVCLALYEGNEVCGVFPCTVDDEVYTVQDALDALADGDVGALLDEIGGGRAAHRTGTGDASTGGDEVTYNPAP